MLVQFDCINYSEAHIEGNLLLLEVQNEVNHIGFEPTTVITGVYKFHTLSTRPPKINMVMTSF